MKRVIITLVLSIVCFSSFGQSGKWVLPTRVDLDTAIDSVLFYHNTGIADKSEDNNWGIKYYQINVQNSTGNNCGYIKFTVSPSPTNHNEISVLIEEKIDSWAYSKKDYITERLNNGGMTKNGYNIFTSINKKSTNRVKAVVILYE